MASCLVNVPGLLAHSTSQGVFILEVLLTVWLISISDTDYRGIGYIGGIDSLTTLCFSVKLLCVNFMEFTMRDVW